MIKKTAKICAIVLGALLLVAIAGYITLGYYYSPYFVYGTWINDTYCTGMDVTAVNQSLIDATEDYILTIEEQNGKQETITGEQIDYAVDYTSALNEIKNRQNPFNWGYYYFYPVNVQLKPQISYDAELLEHVCEELKCYQLEALNGKLAPKIKKSPDGYVLKDHRVEIIDPKKTSELIRTAIEEGNTTLSLSEQECYYMPELSAEEEKTYDLWSKIEKAQSAQIALRDGALELILDGGKISDWICVDEKGDFLLKNDALTFDEEKINAYTDEIAQMFNSKGNVRTWTRDDGKVVTIHSKGKGYIVDREAETAQIFSALERGSKIGRKPIYSQVGEPREEIDMGNTYIEVDMTAQKLYYYKNKKLALSTDIVTGNLARRHDTPSALCEVYYMQKNRTLHGADYESFVYYWMAVKGNIGIHDATWRDEFGGDIYKTAGSHGCINLPKEKAAALYDMIKIGTPVIMYYTD